MFDQLPGNSARKASPEGGNGPRFYVVLTGVSFLVLVLYLGWFFLSRWLENRAIEEKVATQHSLKAQQDYEKMGGNRFEISGFSVLPSSIQAGDTTFLCYSVANAKSVKFEPESQPISPAAYHCVQVSPRKTTTYTLTAEDAAGNTKTATAEVEVHR
jgi:hypothetical protein